MLIRILRDYLRPYYGQLVIVVLLQLVANAAALYLPTLNARIVDDGIAKGNTGLILSLGVLMLVVTVVQMAAQIGAVWFGARSAMAFGRDLRAAVFGRTGMPGSCNSCQKPWPRVSLPAVWRRRDTVIIPGAAAAMDWRKMSAVG